MVSQSQGIQSYTIEQYDASKTTVEWLLNSQEQHPEEVQTQSQEDTTPKKKASQRVFNEEDDDEDFKSPSSIKPAASTMTVHPDFADEDEPPRPLSPRSEAYFAPTNPRWAHK